MTMYKEEYRQLLSLTQSYLLNEFTSKDRITTDAETFSFFRKYHAAHEPLKSPTGAPPLPQAGTVTPATRAAPPISIPARIESDKKQHTVPLQEKPVPLPPQLNPTDSRQKEIAPPEVEAQPQPTTKPPVLTLEPLGTAPKFEYEKIYSAFHNLFPNLPVIAQIPDDAEAKKIGNRWKKETVEPEVVILSFNEPAQSKAFLKNLAQAVHLHLGATAIYPAHVIDQKDKWQQLLTMKKLKLIITTDFGMYSLPKLMRFYKESPNRSLRYLGEIPVLLITDPAVYFKQPHLKSSLWRALTSLLQSPRS